jgi:hypothetical protein
MTLQEVEHQLNRKWVYLSNSEVKLAEDVRKLQIKLFDLLSDKTLSELTFDKFGNVARTPKNFELIANIDQVFDVFNEKYQSEVINMFGNQLLGVTEYVKDYYLATGFAKNAILKGLEKAKWIENSIGFNGKEILKGGYLDTLLESDVVRQEVKDLMLKNLSSNQSLKKVTKDLKDFVKGSGDQAGKLERYYKQYAYDTFNQVDESINQQVADELQLNYFVYSGTKIKTTRKFCKDRIRGVFTRAEAEAWDSEDWAGKSGPFFPNRGGYNCRHQIGWISEKLYNKLKDKE